MCRRLLGGRSCLPPGTHISPTHHVLALVQLLAGWGSSSDASCPLVQSWINAWRNASTFVVRLNLVCCHPSSAATCSRASCCSCCCCCFLGHTVYTVWPKKQQHGPYCNCSAANLAAARCWHPGWSPTLVHDLLARGLFAGAAAAFEW